MYLVDQFVERIIAKTDYTEMDYIYLRNRVLALVGEEGANQPTTETDLISLKEKLVQLALSNQKIGDTADEQDTLGAELMNFITPSPSQVNRQFWDTYAINREQAIADFYQLSQDNDYIKMAAIAKNIAYTVETDYGNIEITINLSKPEKDPKAIAAAKQMKASSYPKCLLCMENEGYQGRIGHPARANHRIIRLTLGGEAWGFQYSPYAYFNEHSIILNTAHLPMVISKQTFHQLLDSVEQLPGYFVGSNADLPIVGGSILTHNHYQAGRHTFPMEVAPDEEVFTVKGFEGVQLSIVKWPMSVLRLRGENKAELVDLAEHIRQVWASYSDPSVQVMAETNGEPHHTITPIARRKGQLFELDLVLRDNQISEEHPDGIYHPHQDVQHIKKENIGLIEVMGLAILPPRLKTELEEVAKYVLGQYNDIAGYHKPWADQIKASHLEVNEDNITNRIQEEVGKVFVRVLEDAGVYKRTKEGKAAFLRFVSALGLCD